MLERTGEAVRTLGEGFRNAFAEAFPACWAGPRPAFPPTVGNLAGAPSEALPIPFGEAFPEGMPNQEQEQEQRRKGEGARARAERSRMERPGFPVWRAQGSGQGLRLRRKRFAGRKPAGWGPCGRALAGEYPSGECPQGACGRDAPARRTASLQGALGFASVPHQARTRLGIRQDSGWGIRRPKGRSGLSLVRLLSGRASPGRAPAARGFLSCWSAYPVQQGREDAWREWLRLWERRALPEPLRRAGGHPAHAGRGHALEAGQDPQDGEMAGRDGLE